MSSPTEKAPEASRERILSPDAQQQREDLILNGVIADPEATLPVKVEAEATNPLEMLGDMLSKLDPETREAAVEHFSGLGSPAVAGEAGTLEPTPDTDTADIDAPLAPVIPTIPVVEKKHTTFIDEADIEPSASPAVPIAEAATVPTETTPATVVEIRPGASSEAPVINKPTIAERVAVVKQLIETAPKGEKLSFAERRLINKTSRDARTSERRGIKNGDSEMSEVKQVHEKYDAQDERTNELGVAEHNRTRSVRRETLARQLLGKEEQACADATVDGVFNDRAYRARMKTYKNQLKKSINEDTKTAINTAESNLTEAGKQLRTAEKARKEAIKSRRWYKNTRISKPNRAKNGTGIMTYAVKPVSVRSVGSARIESDDERRRRLERERSAA